MTTTATRATPTCAYAAIRLTGGREWIDFQTIDLASMQDALAKAHVLDCKIPAWAKDNKVVRIARIKIVETDPL